MNKYASQLENFLKQAVNPNYPSYQPMTTENTQVLKYKINVIPDVQDDVTQLVYNSVLIWKYNTTSNIPTIEALKYRRLSLKIFKQLFNIEKYKLNFDPNLHQIQDNQVSMKDGSDLKAWIKQQLLSNHSFQIALDGLDMVLNKEDNKALSTLDIALTAPKNHMLYVDSISFKVNWFYKGENISNLTPEDLSKLMTNKAFAY